MLTELLYIFFIFIVLFLVFFFFSLFPFILHVLCIKIVYMYFVGLHLSSPRLLVVPPVLEIHISHVQIVSIVQLFSRINKHSIQFHPNFCRHMIYFLFFFISQFHCLQHTPKHTFYEAELQNKAFSRFYMTNMQTKCSPSSITTRKVANKLIIIDTPSPPPPPKKR